ncbi:TPA: DUF1642 domain-containing protein [Streptococcus suis]
MNKQEAMDVIESISYYEKVNGNPLEDLVNKIYDDLKPVVPKFVAEWIEYCKSNKLTLLGAFDPVSEHGIGLANTFTGEVRKGIDWAKRNQDTFARAWLDGYEVEKEPLYTVEIPNPVLTDNSDSVTVLMKLDPGVVLTDVVNYIGRKQEPVYHLTESEIKEDFEWAWQWAVPVEDN